MLIRYTSSSIRLIYRPRCTRRRGSVQPYTQHAPISWCTASRLWQIAFTKSNRPEFTSSILSYTYTIHRRSQRRLWDTRSDPEHFFLPSTFRLSISFTYFTGLFDPSSWRYIRTLFAPDSSRVAHSNFSYIHASAHHTVAGMTRALFDPRHARRNYGILSFLGQRLYVCVRVRVYVWLSVGNVGPNDVLSLALHLRGARI